MFLNHLISKDWDNNLEKIRSSLSFINVKVIEGTALLFLGNRKAKTRN